MGYPRGMLPRILALALAWRTLWAFLLRPLWDSDSGAYPHTGANLLRGAWSGYDGARPPVYSVVVGLVNGRVSGALPSDVATLAVVGSAAWLACIALVYGTVQALGGSERRASLAAGFLALLSPVTTWETTVAPFTVAAALVAGGIYLRATGRVLAAGGVLALAALTRAELVILLPLWTLSAWRVWAPMIGAWIGVVGLCTGHYTLTTLGALNLTTATAGLWDDAPPPFGPILAAAAHREPGVRDVVVHEPALTQLFAVEPNGPDLAAALGRASINVMRAHPLGWLGNAAGSIAVLADLRHGLTWRHALGPERAPVRRWPSFVAAWAALEGFALSGAWLVATVRRGPFMGGAWCVILAFAFLAHVSPRYVVPLLPIVLVGMVAQRGPRGAGPHIRPPRIAPAA